MWEINSIDQAVTLAFSICLGGIFCIIYDILRSLRKAGFNSVLTIFVTDILFWIFAAFGTFIFLIARTNGEIRLFVLIGELIGFLLFRLVFSRWILLALTTVFKCVKKLNMYITEKNKLLYLKINSIISKVTAFVMNFLKRCIKSLKKLLKKGSKLLYTDTNKKYNAESICDETKT